MLGTNALADKDDASLVWLCQTGDSSAWKVLVDRYGGLIYSIPARLGLPPEDCADIYQSVITRLLDRIDTVRDAPRLSKWLITTTTNTCWRFLRDRPKEYLVAWSYLEKLGAMEIALKDQQYLGGSTPEEVALVLEEQFLIRQAMAALKTECRRLLAALYYEWPRPTYRAVADRLGLRESTIGTRRARCLETLRSILEERGLP